MMGYDEIYEELRPLIIATAIVAILYMLAMGWLLLQLLNIIILL